MLDRTQAVFPALRPQHMRRRLACRAVGDHVPDPDQDGRIVGDHVDEIAEHLVKDVVGRGIDRNQGQFDAGECPEAERDTKTFLAPVGAEVT